MKSLSFTFILFAGALSGLLYGCSADSTDFPGLQAPEANNIQALTAGEQKALGIANKFLNKKGGTRAGEDCDIQYVMSRAKTRSASGLLSDTLAYVINYADNGGFAIISNVNSTNPVLGFAEEGNFSFSNEIAKENFIDRIEDYLADSGGDGVGEMDTTSHDITIFEGEWINVVEPFVKIKLGQRTPWNNYVILEKPGCPTGCVAVATATVMCYGKETITYHNEHFPLKAIVKEIESFQILKPLSGSETSSTQSIPGLIDNNPILSYNQATDYMAKLMWYIGKDVDMEYTPDESGAMPTRGYELCGSLGYTIPTGFANYNSESVSSYLNNGYIVYLRGSCSIDGGHAWVVDGCKTYAYTTADMKTDYCIYLNCKWGWDGDADGYYSGNVFDCEGKVKNDPKFTPQQYFAVKRGWK